MALKFNTDLRNAIIGSIEAIANSGGASAPRLLIYSGTAPAITVAPTGTLIANILLPSQDWLGAASSGSVAKNGSWTGTIAAVATPGYFRVVKNANNGTTDNVIQGDIPADMTFQTPTSIGQAITIDPFTLTAANT